MNMKCSSFTKERVDMLVEELQQKKQILKDLQQMTAQECWEKDLEDFTKTYRDFRPKLSAQPSRSESVLHKILLSVGSKGSTIMHEDLLREEAEGQGDENDEG